MDKRENLLRLLRRQGYEFAPVEFALCEKLENDYRKFEKTDEDYRDYFQMDWRNAPPLMPGNTDLSRFLPYHGGSLDTWTTLDEWGVGHRKTPSSMHMSQMLFPLKDADSVEKLFPYWILQRRIISMWCTLISFRIRTLHQPFPVPWI